MAAHDHRSDRWRDAALYGAAFVLPFAAYLLTLGPTAMAEDSAELSLAAYVLGVPHPTGYPLYMLLGKAWQLLVPLGSIAYRMNLLSAVTAAAACALIAWVCRLLGSRRSAALLGGLTAGLFRTTWRQSNVAEVYALSALLIALMLGAFLVWHHRRTERSLIALALVCGLAFTHHHISIFFAAPLLGAAAALHRPLRAALLLKMLAAVALPQALYLYLPLRAAANPPLNWENVTTWSAFWTHVTGGPWVARYGFTRRGEELSTFLGGIGGQIRRDLTLLGIVLALAGLLALARRHTLFWACTLVSVGVVAVTGSMSPIYRTTVGDEFLIPCLLVLALWVALGAQWLVGRVTWARLGSGVVRWALPALALGLPAHMAAANWRSVDVSRNWHDYDYAQLVLAEAQPGAVIVLHGYRAYVASLYLQVVEGRRRDVDLVSVDFSGTRWFPPTVRSPAIRRALVEAQALRDMGVAGGPADWTPLVVRLLLSRVEGRRPIYCNVDIDKALPLGWEMLTIEPLRRAAAAPALRFVSQTGKPIGMWPQGIGPTALAISSPRVARGHVLRLTWRWQINRTVETPLGVRIFFTHETWLRKPSPQGPPPTMAFDALRPLGYAVLPLPATVAVTRAPIEESMYLPRTVALEQDTYLVVPRTVEPGKYVIACGLVTAQGVAPPIRVGTVEVVADRR